MDGYLVLAATGARGVDEERLGEVTRVLTAAAPTQVVPCVDPPDLDAALHALDGRTLVVAGGDGTLHRAVEALHRRAMLADTDVGLVPLGTGNDFARGLGLPLDPAGAAEVVVNGTADRLDLIATDDGVVVNAAHAGLGVAAAQQASDLKDRLGPAAYVAGGVMAGARAEPLQLAVTVDGRSVGQDATALLVAVGNGSSVGGGTVLFPHADPSDGVLDVVVVEDLSVWERLQLGLATRRAGHLDLNGVHTAIGAEVTVRGVAAWNDDGELGEPRDGRALRVLPAALHLIRQRPLVR